MTDEHKQTYSQDEVQLAVERELLRHRVGGIEIALNTMREGVRDSFASLNSAVSGIERSLREHNASSMAGRAELRSEIEADFVTKLDFQAKFNDLEKKVDRMWIRISTAVGVVVFIAELALKYVLK